MKFINKFSKDICATVRIFVPTFDLFIFTFSVVSEGVFIGTFLEYVIKGHLTLLSLHFNVSANFSLFITYLGTSGGLL
jgi:hypothetical protein